MIMDGGALSGQPAEDEQFAQLAAKDTATRVGVRLEIEVRAQLFRL
jgi:hypothetical protein